MSSLGDKFPEEQARIRQCILNGKEIGPSGAFYVMMAEDLLRRADKAVMEQDIVKMVQIYREMQEFKE